MVFSHAVLLEQNKTCCLIHSSQSWRVRGGEGRGRVLDRCMAGKGEGKSEKMGESDFLAFCAISAVPALFIYSQNIIKYERQNRETA